MVIAIDGTVASGKGTVAKLLAKKLNFHYLDTGSIYRAITVLLLNSSLTDKNWQDKEVKKLLDSAKIEIKADKILLNGKDITERIRDNEISCSVAVFGRSVLVQDKVHEIQHQFAQNNDLVVEGRETTSVAFPNAQYKFYMDCDVDLRAKRRYNDLMRTAKDSNVTLEEVKKQIEERDFLDKTRKISPLVMVKDAIYIDGAGSPEEVAAKILDKIGAV
ncbi:MAG: (d)CMP kinase [Christensenellaceae bacterium]|jgi:cytidylate kinase|nr:(d)CMP kinase [Christensenellaceae bacterium]